MLADISRIKSALDWMPSVPFEKGLKEIKDRVKAGSENSFSSGIDDILLEAAA
jgi:dTDP-D-glucose 4,6-dehydratase